MHVLRPPYSVFHSYCEYSVRTTWDVHRLRLKLLRPPHPVCVRPWRNTNTDPTALGICDFGSWEFGKVPVAFPNCASPALSPPKIQQLFGSFHSNTFSTSLLHIAVAACCSQHVQSMLRESFCAATQGSSVMSKAFGRYSNTSYDKSKRVLKTLVLVLWALDRSVAWVRC